MAIADFQQAFEHWKLYANLYREDGRFRGWAEKLNYDFAGNRPCCKPKPELALAYIECPLMFDYESWLAEFLRVRGMRLLTHSERMELSRLEKDGEQY